MSVAVFTGDIVIRVDLAPLSTRATSIPLTYTHLGFNAYDNLYLNLAGQEA